MMQVLAAGGMPILSDGWRGRDKHNPLGYFEYGPAMQMGGTRSGYWIDRAEGHAVKVLVGAVPYLPSGRRYKIVLMIRPYTAIARSFAEMRQQGIQSQEQFKSHVGFMALRLEQTIAWLATADHIEHIKISYDDLLEDSASTVATVSAFLDCPLDQEAMVSAIKPHLRHWVL
jgi:hypothetical protein